MLQMLLSACLMKRIRFNKVKYEDLLKKLNTGNIDDLNIEVQKDLINIIKA